MVYGLKTLKPYMWICQCSRDDPLTHAYPSAVELGLGQRRQRMARWKVQGQGQGYNEGLIFRFSHVP